MKNNIIISVVLIVILLSICFFVIGRESNKIVCPNYPVNQVTNQPSGSQITTEGVKNSLNNLCSNFKQQIGNTMAANAQTLATERNAFVNNFLSGDSTKWAESTSSLSKSFEKNLKKEVIPLESYDDFVLTSGDIISKQEIANILKLNESDIFLSSFGVGAGDSSIDTTLYSNVNPKGLLVTIYMLKLEVIQPFYLSGLEGLSEPLSCNFTVYGIGTTGSRFEGKSSQLVPM